MQVQVPNTEEEQREIAEKREAYRGFLLTLLHRAIGKQGFYRITENDKEGKYYHKKFMKNVQTEEVKDIESVPPHKRPIKYMTLEGINCEIKYRQNS
jgi:hypothetical protein